MAIRVVEFSNRGYKIIKIFAYESTYSKKLLNFENWSNGGFRVLKVNYFHLLRKKKYLILKSWFDSNSIIVLY